MSREQELFDASAYLREHAETDFKKMPEKTVAAVLNTLSPEARKAFAIQYLGVEHAREAKRNMPFEPKLTDEDILGDLPPALQKTIGKIGDERIVNGLHERMGTAQAQAELNNQPPSLRETLSAAAGDSNE